MSYCEHRIWCKSNYLYIYD